MNHLDWVDIKGKYPAFTFSALLKCGYCGDNNIYLLRNKDEYKDWIINKSMYNLLNKFNGTNTLEEILNSIHDEYKHENIIVIKEKVIQKLQGLVSKGLCNLNNNEYSSNLTLFDKTFEYPLDGLSICLTTRCNFDCLYCYVERTNPTDLPNDQYIKIIDESINDLGIIQIGLTGGEPLIINDLPYLIEYPAKKGCKVTVLTNGYLLSKEYSNTLKNAGVYRLAVSFDSDKPDTFDYLTNVPSSYETVLENISYANSIGMRITVGVVLIKCINDTKENLINLSKILTEVGVESISYTNIFPFGKAAGLNDYILEPEKIADLNEVFQFDKKHFDNCSILNKDIFKSNTKSINQKKLYQGDICDIGKGVLHILPDGRVTPCPSFPDLVIGYVNKDKISTLWSDSSTLKKLRYFKPTEISECSKCKALNWCNGGCRARAFHDAGDLNSSDRWACAMYKSKFIL